MLLKVKQTKRQRNLKSSACPWLLLHCCTLTKPLLLILCWIQKGLELQLVEHISLQCVIAVFLLLHLEDVILLYLALYNCFVCVDSSRHSSQSVTKSHSVWRQDPSVLEGTNWTQWNHHTIRGTIIRHSKNIHCCRHHIIQWENCVNQDSVYLCHTTDQLQRLAFIWPFGASPAARTDSVSALKRHPSPVVSAPPGCHVPALYTRVHL